MTEPLRLPEPVVTPPPVDEEAVAVLARRQAGLVAALVRRTAPPEGFEQVGVDRTAATLVRKRWASVRRHFPGDTAALQGARPTAADDFAAWAREHAAAGGLPLGGFADGVVFLSWVEMHVGLPAGCGGELAAARLRLRVTGPGARAWVGDVELRTRHWAGLGLASAGAVRVAATGTAARPGRVRVVCGGGRRGE